MLTVVALASTLTIGCGVFGEPVANPPDEKLDLTPYVGVWGIDEWQPIWFNIVPYGPNALRGTGSYDASDFSDPEMTFEMRLTEISGTVVASGLIAEPDVPGDESWLIGSVALSADGSQMRLRALDTSVIETAFAAGDLVGSLTDSPEDWGVPVFQVDGLALRSFLQDDIDVFVGGGETVLGAENGEILLERLDAALADVLSATAMAAPIRPSDESDSRGYPQPPTDNRAAVPGAETTGSSGARASTPSPMRQGAASHPTYAYPAPRQSPAPEYRGDQAAGSVPPGALRESDWGGAVEPGMPPPIEDLLLLLVVVLVAGVVGVGVLAHVRRRERLGQRVTMDKATHTAEQAGWRPTDDFGPYTSAKDVVRFYAWPVTLILLVAVGPILLLAVLLQGLAFTNGDLDQSPGTLALLRGFSPFVLAFSFGAFVGMAEIVATFATAPSAAMREKWAVLLVMFNAFGTLLAYFVVVSAASSADRPVAWALLACIGFAVVLRTRFVLAGNLSGSADDDGMSLNTGWPYGRFQHMCRERIEHGLLSDPGYAADRLMASCQESDDLLAHAVRIVDSQPEERVAEARARLESIRTHAESPALSRARLARFIVQFSTPDAVRWLLEHAG